MTRYLQIILMTMVIFIVMVISLAAKPKVVSKLRGGIAIIVAISGFIFYGYGYSCVISSKGVAVIKAVTAVCKMYVGANDLDSIRTVNIFSDERVLFLFYLVHFLAS